jgi:hypothetical protein
MPIHEDEARLRRNPDVLERVCRSMADTSGDVEPEDPTVASMDREPQPSGGPDYHAEHAAWVARNAHNPPPVPIPEGAVE